MSNVVRVGSPYTIKTKRGGTMKAFRAIHKDVLKRQARAEKRAKQGRYVWN